PSPATGGGRPLRQADRPAPAGPPRADGPVADQRAARADVRGLHPVRPDVRPELVAGARPLHPGQDAAGRRRRTRRLVGGPATVPPRTGVPGDATGSDPARRPLLVTGMARAGTSWVGKMIETGGDFVYINEPMNPRHPPGRSPGILNADITQEYLYITDENGSRYLGAFRDTVRFRYHLLAELRRNHRPFDLAKAAKY